MLVVISIGTIALVRRIDLLSDNIFVLRGGDGSHSDLTDVEPPGKEEQY